MILFLFNVYGRGQGQSDVIHVKTFHTKIVFIVPFMEWRFFNQMEEKMHLELECIEQRKRRSCLHNIFRGKGVPHIAKIIKEKNQIEMG